MNWKRGWIGECLGSQWLNTFNVNSKHSYLKLSIANYSSSLGAWYWTYEPIGRGEGGGPIIQVAKPSWVYEEGPGLENCFENFAPHWQEDPLLLAWTYGLGYGFEIGRGSPGIKLIQDDIMTRGAYRGRTLPRLPLHVDKLQHLILILHKTKQKKPLWAVWIDWRKWLGPS